MLQENILKEAPHLNKKRSWDTVMRIRIIFSLSVMQFQTFLELSYNL